MSWLYLKPIPLQQILICCMCLFAVIACAPAPQYTQTANVLTPNAYTSKDNDYLTAIRLQQELVRESGSRNVQIYDHATAPSPSDFDQKSLLAKAWLGVYHGIVDTDNDDICETYDGTDRTLRESETGQLVKRFTSTRDAAEFITAQIINEDVQESIGDTSACQFKNPGEVTQFLAYFDLAWLISYSKTRGSSFKTRNLIDRIPAKVLSTYEHKAKKGAPMCSMQDRKRYTHMHMLTHYLWRAYVPMRVDYSWSNSLDELVQQLRYKPLDKWSHATSVDTFARAENRVNPDNGLWLSVAEEGKSKQLVMLVEPGSAADKAGLQRGDTVVAVNGYPASALSSRALRRSLREQMFAQGQGRYQVIKQGMTQPQELSVPYPKKQRNTIYSSKVIRWGSANVGYINIKEFRGFTRDELDDVFAEFKAENINELILDLRYNVGGDTFASSYLAALIIGDDDLVYSNSRLADPAWNMPSQYLESVTNALGLKRVVALTSGMTASASEQLINSLRAHIEVVTVGETTYGKPVVMTGYSICDELLLVSTQMSLNADNKSVPFSGIPPTCPVQDSFTSAPDDISNPPLQTALNLTRTGQCQ